MCIFLILKILWRIWDARDLLKIMRMLKLKQSILLHSEWNKRNLCDSNDILFIIEIVTKPPFRLASN